MENNVLLLHHVQFVHDMLFLDEADFAKRRQDGNLAVAYGLFSGYISYTDTELKKRRYQKHQEHEETVTLEDEGTSVLECFFDANTHELEHMIHSAFFLGFFAPPIEVSLAIARAITDIATASGSVVPRLSCLPARPKLNESFVAILQYHSHDPHAVGKCLTIKRAKFTNCDLVGQDEWTGRELSNQSSRLLTLRRTAKAEAVLAVEFDKGNAAHLTLVSPCVNVVDRSARATHAVQCVG